MEEENKKPVMPIPSRLSPSGKEIIYKCGKCKYELASISSNWRFCPVCGSEINRNIIKEIPYETTVKYWKSDEKYRKNILSKIDDMNRTRGFMSEMSITQPSILEEA